MVAFSLKISILALLQLRACSQSVTLAKTNPAPRGALDSALRGAGIVVTDQVDKAFLLEVEDALGVQLVDRSSDRMEDIMKGLRPMFESLEKNDNGKLGPSAVRYILHRLFVARHGWLMKGLDPAGQLFNASSPIEVLQGKASVRLQDIFEKRLGNEGFGLQEIAVFAAVLETLISMEAVGRLQDLYTKLDLSLDETLGVVQVDEFIDLYMTAYILGREIKDSSAKELMKLNKIMPDVYAFWRQTQKYVREVRREVLGTGLEQADGGIWGYTQFSLMDISAVLVKVGERFGQWSNKECQVMKERLINLEDDDKGCVPLSSFYKGTVASGGKDWQFGESIEYLKENGIIDASDPANMKVMVANYMYAPVNCIASSYYYGVCCIDECESLFGHIERQVRGATASPEDLVALVTALPSNTVPANRTLSPSLSHRLFRIAQKHGGRVPIHGRLFMQWMHMVYPRECAYPHMSGTTKPLDPEAWAKVTRKDPVATREEMRSFVDAPMTANGTNTEQGQCGRWVDEEELFIGGQTTRRLSLHELESDLSTWVATSSVFLLCLAAVAMLAPIQSLKSMKHTLWGNRKQDAPHEPRLVLV